MRKWLGRWADAYCDQDLAAGLLAIGLIPHRQRQKRNELVKVLERTLRRDAALPWRIDGPPFTGDHWSRQLDFTLAASMVRNAGSIRVNLQFSPAIGLMDWWRYFHSEASLDCVLSVAASGSATGRHVRARWPMRISALGDCADFLVEDLTREDSWGGAVYTASPLSRRSMEMELLVAESRDLGGIGDQLEDAKRRNGRVSTDALAVFVPDPCLFDLVNRKTIQHLADLVDASAIIISNKPLDYAPIRELAVQLSHNFPIDMALEYALGHRDWLMVSNAQFLRNFRLQNRALGFARAIQQTGEKIQVDEVPLGPFLSYASEFSFEGATSTRSVPEPNTRAALGAGIAKHLGQANWYGEGDEASEFGRLMHSTRQQDEDLSTRRFLQTALREKDDPEQSIAVIRPDTAYMLLVRVGYESEGYLSVSEPFPDLPPVEDGGCHDLEVILWEPELCKTPRRSGISLPTLGVSSVAEFSLTTKDDTNSIDARITVLHRGRVVQTGRLTGTANSKLIFERDAVTRHNLNGLDERQQFDASFVLNDMAGAPCVHSFIGDQAVVFNMDHDDVRQLIARYQDSIAAITENPEAFSGLRSPGTVKLLRDLAAKGARFRETLHTEFFNGSRFTRPEYIQVVSAQSGKLLPIEFAYDHEVPRQSAQLCPQAEQSLKDGRCGPGCPSLESDPRVMRDYICPLGFWGMRAVIERPKLKPEHSLLHGSFALSPEPVSARDQVISPLRQLLCAASNQANNATPTTVESMWKRIRQRVDDGEKVENWSDWEAEINKRNPSLLALLVHQEPDSAGTPEIYIGAGDALNSDNLYEEFVRTRETDHPVVLLIGCEVSVSELSYESLVALFQKRGASIVVGSLGRVLGREAGPLMAELVDSFSRVTEPSSVGVILRDLRRKMLAEGNPTVLTLTGIGDADWQITA